MSKDVIVVQVYLADISIAICPMIQNGKRTSKELSRYTNYPNYQHPENCELENCIYIFWR